MEGKVAIVTGSSAGIGLATAQLLLTQGASVVVSSRKLDNVLAAVQCLQTDAENDRIASCVCHIGKPEDRARLIQTSLDAFGRIDIVVLNAAVSPMLPSLLTTDEKAWRKVIDVNVTSQFLFVQEVVSKMTGGAIVFVSSVAGFSPASPHPAYGISKTSVFGLTKALSRECGTMGIRVNCVAPGMVKTNFSKPLWSNPKLEKMVRSQTALDRLGKPEEIAAAIVFLASEDASYITGEILVVAGGISSRL